MTGAQGHGPMPAMERQAEGFHAPRQRDVRLDFWRGIAMFIIFIAHFPGNLWTLWIPARFGPSDAAEWFVFCSGFASSIAFGAVFLRHGWAMGTARVVFRVWQVWWVHIGLFIMVLIAVSLGTWALETGDYIGKLNLYPFVNDPSRGLVHLVTLTYVPNYFDILPMYLVILAMIPLVMGLRKLHPFAGLAAVGLLWLYTQVYGLELPGEWWSERPWFFNPFGWALIFFSGFALGSGWVKPPRPDRRLIALAAAFVLLLVPISYYRIYSELAFLKEIRESLGWALGKTDFGLLRWLHFLALAYLGYCLTYGRNEVLYHAAFKPIVKVGQQSLAVFVSSMVLAQIAGMALDVLQAGGMSSELAVLILNPIGFACLIAIAYGAAFFKSQPWRKAPAHKQSAKASAGEAEHRGARLQPAGE